MRIKISIYVNIEQNRDFLSLKFEQVDRIKFGLDANSVDIPQEDHLVALLAVDLKLKDEFENLPKDYYSWKIFEQEIGVIEANLMGDSGWEQDVSQLFIRGTNIDGDSNLGSLVEYLNEFKNDEASDCYPLFLEVFNGAK